MPVTESLRRQRGATWVPVATICLGVFSYLFNLVAAHRLAPASFGAVSALMSVIMIIVVPSLAVQATAARHIAIAPPHRHGDTARRLVVTTWWVAGSLTALCLAASPVLSSLLHVSLSAAVATVLSALPLTLYGGYAGILQGTARWPALSTALLVFGAGRAGCGLLGLVVSPTPAGAMWGVCLGHTLPFLAVWIACRGLPVRLGRPDRVTFLDAWRSGNALLAYYVLTYLDVVIARSQFPHVESGQYAAGALLAKLLLQLPQVVLMVTFPSMARAHAENAGGRRWLWPVGFMALLGVAGSALTSVLSGLVVTVLGGHEYAAVEDLLWLFVLQGTAFAILQIVLYTQVARNAHVGLLLWIGCAAVAGLGLAFGEDTRSLLLIVIGATVAVTVPVGAKGPRRSAVRRLGSLLPPARSEERAGEASPRR